MCGRYVRRSDKQRIAEAFHLGKLPANFILPPDFNIAPTTFQPVIRLNRETGEREMVMMRWGLVPHFATPLADVKAETIQQRAMWRIPFQKRRCLVPADGFYEWQKIDAKTRKPFFYSLNNGQPFAFAGLWDAWNDPHTGDWLLTFAIITTDPNELAAQVHDRMPVILEPRAYDRWLQRGTLQHPDLDQPPLDLLRPFPAEDMQAAPANQAVGNPRNNGPEMLSAPPAGQ